MQFSIFAVIATLATIVATSPMADPSPAGILHRRAINKAYFTEAELADTSELYCFNIELVGVSMTADPWVIKDAHTCCCCVPPSEITNVDHLHKLIAASE